MCEHGVDRRGGTAAASSVLAITLCVFLQVIGCGSVSLSQRVEEIDRSLKRGSAGISELTGFLVPLAEFDFENAAFLKDVRDALGRSRAAIEVVRSSLHELEGYEYRGDLAQLGEYICSYVAAALGVTDEIEELCSGLEEILLAIEPALREEAVVTHMEAPRSNEEWLSRLHALDEALGPSISRLQGVEVIDELATYKGYFQQLLDILHKLVKELLLVASGKAPNVEMEYNPDFLRIEELRSLYPELVKDIYEGLEFPTVDSLMERVELEINRLHLEKAG